MIDVSSADVSEMIDSRFAELLAELNELQSTIPMSVVLAWVGAAITILGLLFAGFVGLFVGVAFTFCAYTLGSWLDNQQRCSVLMYDLDEDASVAYRTVVDAFDALDSCVGKWHINAGGAVRDIHTWKRNAGANHIVDRKPTTFGYGLPSIIKSNITPPKIQSGKETLYFLPDFLLVVHDKIVGAVGYDTLKIIGQQSNFVEEQTLPSDAKVLWYTWRHPNKSGGPDRRFANNYEIPVCEYESMHLSSANGLNELLQLSRAGLVAPFRQSLNLLSKSNGSSDKSRLLPNFQT
ncbi:hypothetical protein ACRAQ6_01875 [Erythrobacter sp. HA6-11]